MVVAQDRGVELGMLRVQAVVRMQVVEVEVKGVVVANTMALDPVEGLVPAQAQPPVDLMSMKVMLVDLLALAVPVVAVVEDKQPEVIMDLVAMVLVVVVDPALVQLITIMEITMRMHILMGMAVTADRAQMAGAEVAPALDLDLAMPTRNSLHLLLSLYHCKTKCFLSFVCHLSSLEIPHCENE